MSRDATTESNRFSEIELPTRKTTSTQTFLETCVLDADLKALKEHLGTDLVEQSDLDRCLIRGLQIVQRKERELSHLAPALTILLQSGAKWNSDVLLDEQKTPYHIICESPGDHHELLDLIIKSSHWKIINKQDMYKTTAVLYAAQKFNGNCFKCLVAHKADVSSCSGNLMVIARYIRSGIDINYRICDIKHGRILPFEASVLRGHYNVAKMLLLTGCSCGVFSFRNNHKFKNEIKPEVEKLMKEWKVHENKVTSLQQRCRNVILNHLYPRADLKVEKLPLPPLLIKFLNIPELDVIVDLGL